MVLHVEGNVPRGNVTGMESSIPGEIRVTSPSWKVSEAYSEGVAICWQQYITKICNQDCVICVGRLV